MEIGARLGGDFITTELVPRSTGIDMVAGAVRLALGEEPDLKPRHPPRGAAIRYLTPRPGRITAISGLEAARRSPEVRIVDVYVSAGETVPEITSSLSRSGHVIAEGATAEAAIRSAEAARDTVRIETVSSSGDAGAC
jgi:biotin carboxylase